MIQGSGRSDVSSHAKNKKTNYDDPQPAQGFHKTAVAFTIYIRMSQSYQPSIS
jgi:hypothetical protein